MALAILELGEWGNAKVGFNIDTGTSRYYRLKIGRNVQRKYGIDWVDDVYYQTPVTLNDAGGSLLNSAKDVFIPIRQFDKGDVFVQLFSFKSPQGKSPAFSRVVKVPLGLGRWGAPTPTFAPSFSNPTAMQTIVPFQSPRSIPGRDFGATYARTASLEDLLAGIVKIAAPLVAKLLGEGHNGDGQNSPSGPAGANGTAAPAGALALLLNSILAKVAGLPGMAGSAVSRSQTLSAVHANRFLEAQDQRFSKPFIF